MSLNFENEIIAFQLAIFLVNYKMDEDLLNTSINVIDICNKINNNFREIVKIMKIFNYILKL